MPPNSEIKGVTDYVYIGAGLFTFLALLFILFIIISLARRKRMVVEQERLTENFREELLRTQLEIQEQTFKTISQEIHDNIGQVLSLAKMNLATSDIEQEHKSSEKVYMAKDLVSKAIQDLRDLSRTLNTETIVSMGLLKAIETELQLIQKTASIETAINVEGTVNRLEPQKELILFRIVQEALHNVIKHSNARQVTVNAVYSNQYLYLKISDDGHGFNISEETAGSGLRNMQSRAKLIGAEWSISSNGQGTLINISIPITS
jgi:two-component system NarL family sensor kinase